MSKIRQQHQITEMNENYVRDLFRLSGFIPEKLDTPDGKQGKSADWKFSKQDLTIICETKTIFSGRQAGLTRDQHERRSRETSQRLEHCKEQLPDGDGLVVFQEQLDCAKGVIPYQSHPIRKEDAHRQFRDWLQDEITGHPIH